MDVKTRVTDGFESIEIMKSIYQPVGTGVLDGPQIWTHGRYKGTGRFLRYRRILFGKRLFLREQQAAPLPNLGTYPLVSSYPS